MACVNFLSLTPVPTRATVDPPHRAGRRPYQGSDSGQARHVHVVVDDDRRQNVATDHIITGIFIGRADAVVGARGPVAARIRMTSGKCREVRRVVDIAQDRQ